MLPGLVVALLFAASVTDAGVSFTRWGRTTCPTGSQVIYKGYTSGPKWSNGGSGSNLLCMHEKPKFMGGTAGRGGNAGMIWGAEFEYSGFAADLMSAENIPGGVIHDQDVPCVLCYVSGSTNAIMVPGRPDCEGTGYDFMYRGILMSEHHDDGRKRSEYICVDHAPEGTIGGQGNNNDAILRPVEIGCGSLPCNPYVDGMEATCAVCTY